MKQSDPDRVAQTQNQPCSKIQSAGCSSRRANLLGSHGSRHGLLVVAVVATLSLGCLAQDAPPFEVSNPKHKKWPAEEASRIYASACDLVARRVRPERPPHLHPKFRLILGTGDDQVIRSSTESEIRLKSWNPASFAEGVVIMAAREIVSNDQVVNIARDALFSAQASVSVNELRQGR